MACSPAHLSPAMQTVGVPPAQIEAGAHLLARQQAQPAIQPGQYADLCANLAHDPRVKFLPDDGRASLVVATGPDEAHTLSAELEAKGLAVGAVRTSGGPARFWIAPDHAALPSDATTQAAQAEVITALRKHGANIDTDDDTGCDDFRIDMPDDEKGFVEARAAIRKLGWDVDDVEHGLMSDDEEEESRYYCRVTPTRQVSPGTLAAMTGLTGAMGGSNEYAHTSLSDGTFLIAEAHVVAGETRVILSHSRRWGPAKLSETRFAPKDDARHLVLRHDETLSDERLAAFIAGLPGSPTPRGKGASRSAARLARLAGGRQPALTQLIKETRAVLADALARAGEPKTVYRTGINRMYPCVSVNLPRAALRLSTLGQEIRSLAGSEYSISSAVAESDCELCELVAGSGNILGDQDLNTVHVTDAGGEMVTLEAPQSWWDRLRKAQAEATSAGSAQKGK